MEFSCLRLLMKPPHSSMWNVALLSRLHGCTGCRQLVWFTFIYSHLAFWGTTRLHSNYLDYCYATAVQRTRNHNVRSERVTLLLAQKEMPTNECWGDVSGDIPDLQNCHSEQRLKLGQKKSDYSLAQMIIRDQAPRSGRGFKLSSILSTISPAFSFDTNLE